MRVPRAGCRLNTWLPYADAATILVAELDAAGASSAAAFLTGNLVLDTTQTDVPPYVLVTNAFAARLLGRPLADATAGTAGSVLHGGMRVGFFPLEFAARNVVGVLEGSDPAVNGQFISLTAHNDHVGFDSAPVDHDSLRAFNTVVRPMGADSPNRAPTADEQTRISALLDSLRKIRRRARPDSIRNGADDDGSGTVAAPSSSSHTPLRSSDYSARSGTPIIRRSIATRSSARSTWT